ncbi:hypothetical protein ACF0H5_021659 [Mactra antiquata]
MKLLEAKLNLKTELRHNDYLQINSRLGGLTNTLKQIEVQLNLSDTIYDIPEDTSNEYHIIMDNNIQSSVDIQLSVMTKNKNTYINNSRTRSET